MVMYNDDSESKWRIHERKQTVHQSNNLRLMRPYIHTYTHTPYTDICERIVCVLYTVRLGSLGCFHVDKIISAHRTAGITLEPIHDAGLVVKVTALDLEHPFPVFKLVQAYTAHLFLHVWLDAFPFLLSPLPLVLGLLRLFLLQLLAAVGDAADGLQEVLLVVLHGSTDTQRRHTVVEGKQGFIGHVHFIPTTLLLL